MSAEPTAAPVTWFSPGRIEVLGKHTDYAGGRSLLAAVDLGVTAHVRPGGDQVLVTSDASPDEHLALLAGRDNDLPGGHWGHYVQTVIDRLTMNFGPIAPCELQITSNLPLASGMSSSSALIVATALALAHANGFTTTEAWREAIGSPAELADYLGRVENGMSFKHLAGHRGVGTFGGSEDHTAMLCLDPGALGVFSFNPVRAEASVPFPDELAFVVAVSGVAAEKTGAARELYNRASLATGELVELWNAEHEPVECLAQILDQGPEALRQLRALVAGREYLPERLEAFVIESTQVIPAATTAFADGQWQRFGELVDQSQLAAETLLGNQVPETVHLAASARAMGALAASSFGAGFGGSVWALLPVDQAERFAEQWLADYHEHFPERSATTIITRPGTPARPL